MISKEEIENKNLLENVDYTKVESKSIVTNFLITKCDKCGNEIKYRLALGDIKDVEDYIQQLENKVEEQAEELNKTYSNLDYACKMIKKYQDREQKLIDKLEEDIEQHTFDKEIDTTSQYAQEILSIVKGEKK